MFLVLLVNLVSITNAQFGSLSQARSDLAAAAAGNKIVFAGGSNGVSTYFSTVDIYDVSTHTWNSTSTGAGQLSVARGHHAAAAVGNKTVFAGGSSGPGTYLSTVDIYDVTTGTWNSTSTGAGQLSVARYFFAAAGTGDKIVFAGGTASGGRVSTVDIYDVSTGTWTSTSTGAGQLSVARWYLAAAATGNKIVFAGGWNGTSLSTVDIYDVSTGTWNSTSTGAGQLSVARYRLAAGAAGNKIVFAGGFIPGAGYLSTVDIYDVTTGIWTSTSTGAGELGVARYRLAAAGVGNKIVFAGGSNDSYLSTVDIYDVPSNTWISTSTGVGQLSGARSDLAAAGTGNVIVFAGGEDENGYSSAVDIYDSQYGMHLASTTTTTAATSTTLEGSF